MTGVAQYPMYFDPGTFRFPQDQKVWQVTADDQSGQNFNGMADMIVIDDTNADTDPAWRIMPWMQADSVGRQNASMAAMIKTAIANGRQVTQSYAPVDGFFYSAQRGNLKAIVDGRKVLIPDLWIASYWTNRNRPSSDLSWTGVLLYSNWSDYRPMDMNNGVDGSISVYAYRDGWDGNTDNPCILNLTKIKPSRGGMWRVRGEFVADIADEKNASSLQEFEYKLARKRVETGWKFDLNSICTLGQAFVNGKTAYMPLKTYNWTNVESVQVTDLGTSVLMDKTYAQQFILRNTSDAPIAMKTTDYSFAHTHTFTITNATSVKVGLNWSTKTTVKGGFSVKVGDVGESSETAVETSITKSFEISTTQTESWTDTDTKTFTATGQLITVPAHTTLKVNYDFWRGQVTGQIKVLMDASVAPFNRGLDWEMSAGSGSTPNMFVFKSYPNVQINWGEAKKQLGLERIVDSYKDDTGNIQKGTYIYAIYDMSAEMGTIGAVNVEPIGEKVGNDLLGDKQSDWLSTVKFTNGAPLAKDPAVKFPSPPTLTKAQGRAGDTQHHYTVEFTVPKERNNEIAAYAIFFNDQQVQQVENAPDAAGKITFTGTGTPGTYNCTVRGVCAAGLTAPSNLIALTVSKGTY